MEWDLTYRLFSDADMAGMEGRLSSLIDRLNAQSDQQLRDELCKLGDQAH